jgi:hypothetical protein
MYCIALITRIKNPYAEGGPRDENTRPGDEYSK